MDASSTKSDLYLRIIAVFKLSKALLFIAVGIGTLHLINKDVDSWLENMLATLRIDSDNHIARWCLRQASTLTKFKLESLSAVCFFYGSLFATEGLGLYFKKRWAEYLVVIMTGSLLPFEVYELYVSVHWFKIVLLIGNIAIFFFLIHLIRTGKR